MLHRLRGHTHTMMGVDGGHLLEVEWVEVQYDLGKLTQNPWKTCEAGLRTGSM